MSDNWNEKLLDASRSGDLSALKEAMNSGADVDTRNDDGYTALILASKYGHIKSIQYLLDAGANCTMENYIGGTALSWTVYRGHADCIQLLIDAGADVNTKGSKTVLEVATGYGFIDCMKVLLDAGADTRGHDREFYQSIVDRELQKRAEKIVREQQKVKLVTRERHQRFRRHVRSRGL